MANAFEKDFEDLFPAVRKRTGAFLYRLYPPMRCVGMRGSMPCWCQVGRALFDVAGWAEKSGEDIAQAIGIELKSTKQRHPSLRIVGEDGDGSGIQAHQLEALAALARDGGLARVLWSNGGVVGCLYNEQITHAFYHYGVSLAVEKSGKTPAKGARSIPWTLFTEIDFYEKPELVVLPPPKEPTLHESMKAKRKKASKLIQEADDALDQEPLPDPKLDDPDF